MSEHESQTTIRPDREGAIALAILSVCSDGNSDPYHVAADVIRSLDRHGYRIVEKDAERHAMADSKTTKRTIADRPDEKDSFWAVPNNLPTWSTPDAPKATAPKEWLDIMNDFVFQISDDVLRENLEAAIARMEALQDGK